MNEETNILTAYVIYGLNNSNLGPFTRDSLLICWPTL